MTRIPVFASVAWLMLALLMVSAAPGPATSAPATTAAQSPQAKATAAPTPTVPAWQQRWDKIVAAGKKEGRVAISTTWGSDIRVELTKAFKAKYGIDLEFSPAGRGAELAAKIKAEQKAGLYLYDFFGTGAPTALSLLKPEGLLGRIEPLLVLPEVTNPKVWKGGKFPFTDGDKMLVPMAAVKQIYFVYNSDLVKKGEITSYKDALKPEYKGKISLNDPTVTGAGNGMFTHLAFDVWNLDEAKAFLRQLVKQQEAVIQRDNRMHVESVARGKYALALGTQAENYFHMINAGAPLAVAKVKEGFLVSSGSGYIDALNKLAHPNAATVFLNWLLSKEGQTVFSKSFGSPSMRVDVAADWANPDSIVQPDEKFYSFDEKKAVAMADMTTVAKQVIVDASK